MFCHYLNSLSVSFVHVIVSFQHKHFQYFINYVLRTPTMSTVGVQSKVKSCFRELCSRNNFVPHFKNSVNIRMSLMTRKGRREQTSSHFQSFAVPCLAVHGLAISAAAKACRKRQRYLTSRSSAPGTIV